jgi:nucleotide-binding universal stress UspA family protein
VSHIESKAEPASLTVIIWIAEATWRASIDAARRIVPPDARMTVLHVTPEDISAAGHSAYAGMLGRGHPERDPGARMSALAATSAAELLEHAATRLARPCDRSLRQGRVEREVVAAAIGADLLIAARDGDRSHLGPKSIGPVCRFVIDHAPCPVLLVWPEKPPDIATLPPRPHPPHHRHH